LTKKRYSSLLRYVHPTRRQIFFIATFLIFLLGFGISMGVFFRAYFPAHDTPVHQGSFVDMIEASGIPPSLGTAGVAWGDYDNDGNLDLFLAGGNEPMKLYHNEGDGTFIDTTTDVFQGLLGLPANELLGGFAGAFADYDNDGCLDLYLAYGGRSNRLADQLWRNDCNGNFIDISNEAGIVDTYEGRGVAWADYNGDGLLDLYVANHGRREKEDVEVHFFEPNILYRNNGDGTFTNVTQPAGVEGTARCSFVASPSEPQKEFKQDDLRDWLPDFITVGGELKLAFQPLWFDYNNNGLADLLVTNENGVSPLYRNNGDGTFTDVTEAAGLCRWATAMGVTAGDYDNDGYFDLYITNVTSMVSFLWHNNGDGTFTEVSQEDNKPS